MTWTCSACALWRAAARLRRVRGTTSRSATGGAVHDRGDPCTARPHGQLPGRCDRRYDDPCASVAGFPCKLERGQALSGAWPIRAQRAGDRVAWGIARSHAPARPGIHRRRARQSGHPPRPGHDRGSVRLPLRARVQAQRRHAATPIPDASPDRTGHRVDSENRSAAGPHRAGSRLLRPEPFQPLHRPRNRQDAGRHQAGKFRAIRRGTRPDVVAGHIRDYSPRAFPGSTREGAADE